MRNYLKLFFLGVFLLGVIFSSRGICLADFKEEALDLRNKGLLAQGTGDIDKALGFYLQARKKWSSWPVIYNDIGVIYELQNRINEAESVYLKAIQFDSYYPSSYANLAFLYEKKQDFKNAIFYWRKRIQLGGIDDPWVKTARERIAILKGRIGLQESDRTDELIKQRMKDAPVDNGHIFPFDNIDISASVDELSRSQKLTKIENAKIRAQWYKNQGFSVLGQDELESAKDLKEAIAEEDRLIAEEDRLKELEQLNVLIDNSAQSLEILRKLSKDEDPEVRKSAEDALWYNSQGFGMLAGEEAERIMQMRSLPSSKSQTE